ncbi:hypothetical protein NIES4103_48170 [Nostoc sp. NIES-4103]|nr:hypothetical protein NIES4103_48170 [Nostoc sp. NIES-4103]
MGLAQTQQVLAQLYTNTEFRERFFANPQAVGAELGLSCDEAQQLAEVSAKEVGIFANSLKWKRLGEVRELLPRTARVLGKNFTALFWRYAEKHLPKGIKKHREDAIAFANFIIQVAQKEGIEPVWLRDLVRYEKTWLLAYEPATYLKVCWFRYPINKLGNSQTINPQPTIAIWLRLRARSQLFHQIWGLGSRE